jgi:hypothetical protein
MRELSTIKLEPVVNARKGNDPWVYRGVVIGVDPSHGEAPIEPDLSAEGVPVPERALHPHRDPQQKERTGPFVSPSPEAPEAHTGEGEDTSGSRVALDRHRQGPVAQSKGGKSDFRAPAPGAEFGNDTGHANSPELNAEPDRGTPPSVLDPWGRRRLGCGQSGLNGHESTEGAGRDGQPEGRPREGGAHGKLRQSERGSAGLGQQASPPLDGRSGEGNPTPNVGGGGRRSLRGLVLCGLGLLALLPGCGDGGRSIEIPEAARGWLEVGQGSTAEITPGVRLHQLRSGREPWSLHVLEVDLKQCALGFQLARGPGGVAELLDRVGGRGIAAWNGDFFTEEGVPIGVDATGGALRGRVPRPVFAWRVGEGPTVHLGAVHWGGDTLHLGGWHLVRGAPDGRTELVSGFPALLSGGSRVGDLGVDDRPGFAGERHPRTAMGWDPVRDRVWIVVVDGRRAGVSEGMTLPELAAFLETLGATEALNLDGGGSSVLVVGGRVVSRPSDPGGARPVANALLLVEDPAFCDAG